MQTSTIGSLLGLLRPPQLRDQLFWLVLLSGALIPLAFRILFGTLEGGFSPSGLYAWIIVIGWQPLVEELLFRGLIQGTLLDTRWGGQQSVFHLSHANLLTSALFVTIHFVNHHALWAISVLLPSLIFGWLRERHGNIWSALIAHATFNLAFFVTLS
ncbi:MAG: JDVT-CTERM system CAAX-type protease [Gammaproteobacteria bacterium]|nr:JDVT-CTERM system CAAX-type protease [Gammaproteobacteria bacterium]